MAFRPMAFFETYTDPYFSWTVFFIIFSPFIGEVSETGPHMSFCSENNLLSHVEDPYPKTQNLLEANSVPLTSLSATIYPSSFQIAYVQNPILRKARKGGFACGA